MHSEHEIILSIKLDGNSGQGVGGLLGQSKKVPLNLEITLPCPPPPKKKLHKKTPDVIKPGN